MRKLILLNREEIDVWIDPRLSNGDSPFEDLPTLEGFPGIVKAKASVNIDISDFSELLYRRSLSDKPKYLFALYRVPLPLDQNEVKSSIWQAPTVHPARPVQSNE
jgi:hypothetical protein